MMNYLYLIDTPSLRNVKKATIFDFKTFAHDLYEDSVFFLPFFHMHF